LNCQLGLKLAQVARLVDVTRPTASRQNKLSSREVVREIQQQLHGKRKLNALQSKYLR